MPASSAPTTIAQTVAAPQRRLFQDVLDALAAAQVDFAVAGAFALQRYTGIVRLTKDLDLFLPVAALPAALRACRRIGLRAHRVDPVWLAKARQGIYFVDLITGMSNGVVWVTPSWIEQAAWDDILGRRTRVLAAEELLLSKVFVMRRDRFDGSDICHLIYHCGSRLDWSRVLAGIGAHWELLLWYLQLFRYVYPEAEDCVPEALWRELLHRRPEGRGFRGMLVDPVMFAHDVNELGMENQEAQARRRRLAA